jgi:hypothetical protein
MGKEVRVAFPSRQAAIVGVYITAQGRNMGRSMVDLELEALKGALDDAGLSFKDIDGLATNTYHSPVGGSDDPRLYWAEQLGQQNLGVMEAGMASGALAKMAVCISAGMCDTAVMLAGGFDPPPTIDTASGGKVNPAQVALPDTAPYVGEWDYSIHGGARAAFYAAWARRYMHEFGATVAAATQSWLACVDSLGAAREILDMTVRHLSIRRAFDTVLGTFQAVQHHAAQMVTELTAAALLSYQAVPRAMDQLCLPDQLRCDGFVPDALRWLALTAHQLHGGIGYSLEYPLHRFTDRIRSNSVLASVAPHDARTRIGRQLLSRTWSMEDL